MFVVKYAEKNFGVKADDVAIWYLAGIIMS
jgi:hypothetical protein